MFAPPDLPADPLLILVLALALAGALAGVGWSPVAVPSRPPLRPVHALGAWLERRLNRPSRPPAVRQMRGALAAAWLVALGVGAAGLARGLARELSWGWLVELVLVALALRLRPTLDEVRAVLRAHQRQGVGGMREVLVALGAAGAEAADGHGLARIAIERLTIAFAAGVVAAGFWYAVGGLAALFAYAALEALVRSLDAVAGRTRAFGYWPRWLLGFAALIPARVAAWLLVGGAVFTPTARPGAAWRALGREGAGYRSAHLAAALAATAAALGLALAGPRPGAPAPESAPWIGAGRARAEPQDLRRAVFLVAAAALLGVGLLLGLTVLAGRG